MQIINQENQKLVSQAHYTIDNNDRSNKDVYRCNECLSIAQNPVVTQCSHLYCWPCISQQNNFKFNHCRVCSELIKTENLRPLFISQSNKQSQFDPSLIQSRPKGLNSQPIRNNTSIGDQINQHYYMKNNVDIGLQVPGICPLPSNLILLFNNFEQNSQRNGQYLNKDVKEVVEFTEKLRICLLISLVIIILGVLFLSFSL